MPPVPDAMPIHPLAQEQSAISGAWRAALASLPWPKLESLLPLPKDHSQSAQDLLKKSTLNPGTGGSNEKAVSRKRSAGRVGLGGAGGIRCRKAGAGIYAPATAGSGLHLEWLLRRCKRGHVDGTEHPNHAWQLHPDRRRVG